MELKGKSLVPIKGSEIFDTTGIFLMLPFSKNNKKILIGTRDKGFWVFEPENISARFQKFRVDNPELFEKAEITGENYTEQKTGAFDNLIRSLFLPGKFATVLFFILIYKKVAYLTNIHTVVQLSFQYY